MVRTLITSLLVCGLVVFSGCGGDSKDSSSASPDAKNERDSGGLGAAMKEKTQGVAPATPPANGAAPTDAAAPAQEAPAQP
jgi:hypothetical protein